MGLLDLLKGRRARRLRVLVCGHPTLRRRSEPVPAVTPEICELASRMVVTMFENEVVGVGLAAPQVGLILRLITLATHDPAKPVPPDASPGELLLGPRMPLALVNPEILWSSAERETREEGCLSVPEVSGLVERPARIVVRATTLDGEVIQLECGGLLGRCIQHEVDHLDGILFIDRLRDEDRAALMPQIEALARRVRARVAGAEAVPVATAGEASG
jgi:peptide deformylase